MYGKLIDGELVPAPDSLVVTRILESDEEEGETIAVPGVESPPSIENLLAAGCLPVSDAQPPEAPAGQHYEANGWAVENGQIVQVWALVDNPDPEDEEISAEEALDIIFGGDDNAVD